MRQMIRKNHMDIAWHEYTDENGGNIPVTQASLTEKASIIGRVGIMLLSCGTGAWRVRSSMNTLAEVMEKTCQEKNCILFWMISKGFMGCTLRLPLDLPLRLHAADLHFSSAEDRWKCSVLLSVQALETFFAAN